MKEFIKNNWLKFLVAVLAGFGFSMILLIVIVAIGVSGGLSEANKAQISGYVIIAEGTITWGMVTAWLFSKFKK